MDVLEELTDFESKIDKNYVEQRVEDWEGRLKSLYANIMSWLPPEWAGAEDGFVLMSEEMMHKFGVQSRRLPFLRLSHPAHDAIVVEPRGLWIIGANGRVDVVGPFAHEIIIDRSGIFERPEWMIAPLAHRLDRRPFDRAALLDVLA